MKSKDIKTEHLEYFDLPALMFTVNNGVWRQAAQNKAADSLCTDGTFITDMLPQNELSELLSSLSSDSPVFLHINRDIYSVVPIKNESSTVCLLHKMTSYCNALNKAVTASRAKTDFLSEMSHDIRTPMNAITGLTEIALSQPGSSPKIKECLEKIKISSEHMMSLLNEVLDISRIESGKITLRPESVSVSELIGEILTVAKPQADAGGLSLKTEAGQIFSESIIADSVRLKQICLNLLSNAIKYTPSGGKIEFFYSVEPCKEPERVRLYIRIKDSGIGMSKEFQLRLFEPFEREETSAVNKIQGSGLGMAITKKLIDLMQGDIMVESAPGRGSCFTLVIPFKAALRSEKEQRHGHTDNTVALAHKRILLVDDNELNREIAAELLSRSGADIETAENGKEALECFMASEPFYYDLILMDIQMPVMNGLDAVRAIRSLSRSDAACIPILAMTANAFDEDVQNARGAGMDAHLSKPLDMGRVFSAMEFFLNRKDPVR